MYYFVNLHRVHSNVALDTHPQITTPYNKFENYKCPRASVKQIWYFLLKTLRNLSDTHTIIGKQYV